jgi:hypothetical protein
MKLAPSSTKTISRCRPVTLSLPFIGLFANRRLSGAAFRHRGSGSLEVDFVHDRSHRLDH